MKICFIGPKAYSLFNQEMFPDFGGAEVQLFLLAKELAKNKNLDVNFIVADYGQKELELYYGIKVWKAMKLDSEILNKILKFYNVLNRIDADVYVDRTLKPESSAVALYCKLKKKKFAYMLASDIEVDSRYSQKKGLIRSFISKLAFKLADIILVQNEYQQKRLKTSENVFLLPPSFYQLHNIFRRKNHILWVGRSESLKQPFLFLELAKKFPKEKFVIVCPPSTPNPKLSMLVEKNARKIKNISFIKQAPFNKINSYYKKAKIFVNTSEYEGFPVTFVQAASMGVPLLSLNVDPNKFIEKNNCGFVCSGDFILMKKMLNKMVFNKKLLKIMADNSYKYAKKNFNIKKNTKKFANILRLIEEF